MNPSNPDLQASGVKASFFWDEVRAATFAVAERNRLARKQAANSTTHKAPAARPAARAVTARASAPPPRAKR